jgi:hypothetical protein
VAAIQGRIIYTPPQASNDPSIFNELGEAAHRTAGTLAAVPGAIGQALGLPNNAYTQFSKSQNAQADADSQNSSLTQNLSDIHSVGNAVGFGVHELIQGAPFIGSVIAGAAVGAAAAPELAVAGAVGEAATGGALGDAAVSGASNLLSRAASIVTSKAAGGAIGGAVGSYPLTLGNTLSDQQAVDGKTDLGTAALASIPEAGLNVVGAPGFLTRGLESVAGPVAGNLLARVAKGGLAEGATQAGVATGQQALTNVATGQNISSDLPQAAITGAAIGGVLGGAGGVIHKAPVPGQATDATASATAPVAPTDAAASPSAPPSTPPLALPAPSVNVDAQGNAQLGGLQSADTPAVGSGLVNPASRPNIRAQADMGNAAQVAGGTAPLASAPLDAAPTPAPVASTPMLALPAPPVRVNEAGVAGVPPVSPQEGVTPAGQQYAAQINQRAQALNEGTAAMPAADAAMGKPPPPAAAPVPPAQVAATLAADGRFEQGAIVQQLRQAGAANGKLPPVNSFTAQLSTALSTALKSGDVSAARAAIDDAATNATAKPLGQAGQDRVDAQIAASHQLVNDMVNEIAKANPRPEAAPPPGMAAQSETAGPPVVKPPEPQAENEPTPASPAPPAPTPAPEAAPTAGPGVDEIKEAQDLTSPLTGAMSKNMAQQVLNAHARGDATIEQVRQVSDLLAARKYGVARKLVDALPDEAKEPIDEANNESTGQAQGRVDEDTSSAAPDQAADAKPAGDDPAAADAATAPAQAADGEDAAGRGSAEPAPEVKDEGAAQAEAPGRAVQEEREGAVDGEPAPEVKDEEDLAPKQSPAEREQDRIEALALHNNARTTYAQAQIARAAKAMRDGSATIKDVRDVAALADKPQMRVATEARVKQLEAGGKTDEPSIKATREVVDAAHAQGALNVADHREMHERLDNGKPADLAEVQAKLAGAQRRMMADQAARDDARPVGRRVMTPEEVKARMDAQRSSRRMDIAASRNDRASDTPMSAAPRRDASADERREATLKQLGAYRSGMSKAKVEDMARQEFGSQSIDAKHPRVVVHQSMLDDGVNQQVLKAYNKGLITQGYYDRQAGTVHVIADHVQDLSMARAVLYHEFLGHHGLEQAFGTRLESVLSDIDRTNPLISKLADEWQQQFAGTSLGAAGRRYAVEEVMAEIMEKGPPASTLPYTMRNALTRVINVVRSFGRQMGLIKTYSNADVANVLRQTVRAATRRDDPGAATYRAPTGRLVGDNVAFKATIMDKAKAAVDDLDVRKAIDDMAINKSSAARSFVLKTVTRDQTKYLYGKDLPELQTLGDLTSRRSVFGTEHMEMAASALHEYDKLSDHEAGAVSDLLMRARDASEAIEDAQGRKGMGQAESAARQQRAQVDDELKGLSPQQQMAFAATQTYYKQAKAQTLAVLLHQIDATTMIDAGVKDNLKTTLKAQMNKVQDYVPRQRSGDHVVIAQKPGEKNFVTQHDKLSDAMAQSKAMEAQGYTVRRLLRKDYDPRQDGVSPEFMSRINDMFDAQKKEPGADPAAIDSMRSMANQMFLDMLPESTKARAAFSSKNIPGYIKDQREVLARAGMSNAFMIGALKYDPQIRQSMNEMEHRANATNRNDLQQVVAQTRAHYAALAKATDAPVVDFLNSTTYAYVLGGSPAFSFMHAMQTPLVSAPMIGAIHGFAQAYYHLGKAGAESIKAYTSTMMKHADVTQFGKTPDEKVMLAHIQALGKISGTESQQFLHTTLSRGVLPAIGQKIMGVATFMPHHTEKFNRIITALAAYRLNMQDGKHVEGPSEGQASFDRFRQDFPDNFKPGGSMETMTLRQYNSMRDAENMIDKSHINYGADNAPYLMQKGVSGSLGKLAFQFQKYQQGMLFELYHNTHAIFDKSLSPEERFAGFKTVAGVLGTHALMTGAMGLPGFGFAVAATDAYQFFLGDHDNPFEAEAAYRNTMAKIFGQQTAQVLDRGILYAPGIKDLIPADVTNRLGMGDLLSSARLTGAPSSDAFMGYFGQEATGATGALLSQIPEAMQAAHEGDSWRAAEDLLPKALRDVSKSIRYSQYGVNSVSGAPVVAQQALSTGDLVSQALGLEPQDIATAQASRAAVSTAKAELQDQQTVLAKKYVDAVTQGGDVQQAMDDIQQYNSSRGVNMQANMMIKPDDLSKAVKARFMAENMLAGGESLTGQNVRALGQYGAFAGADRGANAGP